MTSHKRLQTVDLKKIEKALHNNQDLNMPISGMSSRIEQLKNERPTEWTPQMKNIDNGFVEMRDKYVLRPRLSWTGLYGKEPWPRERKQWEKVLKNWSKRSEQWGKTVDRPEQSRLLV